MSGADMKMESMLVAGVSARVSNDDPAAIGALWARFRAADIAAPTNPDIICVYHDYEGDHEGPFRMTIGHRQDAAIGRTGDLATVTVPAQPVIVRDASGSQPDALIAAWQAIWGDTLPRAFVADVEFHDAADPEQVTIHVGIRP